MRPSPFTSALLITALSVCSACASSGGGGGGESKPAKMPSPEELQQRMTAMATPGPAHQVLNSRVGTWAVQMKMWNPGGGEPTSTRGTSEVKWIFDGRYLEDRFAGDVMGMPFQGLGHVGYDNLKKRYVWTWIDNFGTAIMSAEGDFDPATKTFHYDVQMPSPVFGKTVKARTVEVTLDNDHWHFEIWEPGVDGKEKKSMEADYTRVR